MEKLLKKIEKKLLAGKNLEFEEAKEIADYEFDDPLCLISLANKVRRKFKGEKIIFCSITNAKSGNCSEDCAFCAQSAHFKTDSPKYPLLSPDEILSHARKARENGATEFSIVTSGKEVKSELEFDKICNAIKKIKDDNCIITCASLGMLTREKAIKLKEAGLQNYHHNLETSKSYFRNICTTHTFEENIDTVSIAKEVGLSVCCGGIFGMGESNEDRIELAFTLKELGVNCIPINFLHPIKGTMLENVRPLRPLECLKIISIYRLILPEKDIVVCGGREKNLRDLQSLIFFAGANGLLLGNYLTTMGRASEQDLIMIRDLEMEI